MRNSVTMANSCIALPENFKNHTMKNRLMKKYESDCMSRDENNSNSHWPSVTKSPIKTDYFSSPPLIKSEEPYEQNNIALPKQEYSNYNPQFSHYTKDFKSENIDQPIKTDSFSSHPLIKSEEPYEQNNIALPKQEYSNYNTQFSHYTKDFKSENIDHSNIKSYYNTPYNCVEQMNKLELNKSEPMDTDYPFHIKQESFDHSEENNTPGYEIYLPTNHNDYRQAPYAHAMQPISDFSLQEPLDLSMPKEDSQFYAQSEYDIKPDDYEENSWLKKIQTGTRSRVRSPKSWEFLLRLLMDKQSNPSMIKWEDERTGTFRLVRKDEIAKIWGMRSNKHKDGGLSYDNFARNLRYHYKTKMLVPVSEKHLVYRFSSEAMEKRHSFANN